MKNRKRKSGKDMQAEGFNVTWDDLNLSHLAQQSMSSFMEGFRPEFTEVLLLANGCLDQTQHGHIPAWVKNASDRAFKDMMPSTTQTEPFQMGWLFGLCSELLSTADLMAKKDRRMKRFADVLHTIKASLPKIVSSYSVDVLAEFYNGAKEGQLRVEYLNNLPYNPKCFLLLSVGWWFFDGKSMGEVHRQFVEWRLISPDTESRVTRALLSSIGFPAGRAGRRPKNQQNPGKKDAAKIRIKRRRNNPD